MEYEDRVIGKLVMDSLDAAEVNLKFWLEHPLRRQNELMSKILCFRSELIVQHHLKQQMTGEADILQNAKNHALILKKEVTSSLVSYLQDGTVVHDETQSFLIDGLGYRDETIITVLDARLSEVALKLDKLGDMIAVSDSQMEKSYTAFFAERVAAKSQDEASGD